MAVKIRSLPTRELHDAFLANVESARANGLYPPQLAPLLAIPQDCLYKMLEWNEHTGRPHIFPWPDRIARLTEIAGNASYLQAICESAGHFAIPRPERGNATYRELARSIESNARMVSKAAAVLSDGVIDAEEARRDLPQITKLIDAAQRDLEGLRAKLLEDGRIALNGSAATLAGRPNKHAGA